MANPKVTGAFSADNAARFQEKGLDQLDLEDVLAALEQDGIQDLEQLVNRQLAEGQKYVRSPSPIDIHSLETCRPKTEGGDSVHRIPQMPVLIDNVLYDPKDITRFNGNTLHFMALSSDESERFRAYSGEQWRRSLALYLQIRDMTSLFGLAPLDIPIPGVPPPPGPGGPGLPPPPPDLPLPGGPGPSGNPPPPGPAAPPAAPSHPKEAQFFSDAGYTGDWLWLGPRLQWSDLTRVSRAKVLFWSSNWNDVISSVISWYGIVVLCEHINLGGSTFGVQAALPIHNLTSYGWNDRVSSIVNWG